MDTLRGIVRSVGGASRDEELLAEIEAVYRKRFGAFLRLAAAITRDEQGARDAVHDAFVRAVRHRGSFEARSSMDGWVCRIVLNEARKRQSAEQRRVTAVAPQVARTATGNGYVEKGAVEAALASLPERQRLALFLRYYADLDYAAIGESLGVARGTVSATLHAARENLAKRLAEAEG